MQQIRYLEDAIKGSNGRISRIGGAALLAGALASAAWATYSYCQRRAQKQRKQGVDAARDTSLKQTFPASDPPASQYFDIPINRR